MEYEVMMAQSGVRMIEGCAQGEEESPSGCYDTVGAKRQGQQEALRTKTWRRAPKGHRPRELCSFSNDSMQHAELMPTDGWGFVQLALLSVGRSSMSCSWRPRVSTASRRTSSACQSRTAQPDRAAYGLYLCSIRMRVRNSRIRPSASSRSISAPRRAVGVLSFVRRCEA